MSTDAAAVTGFVALFALMMLRVPVGIAMGLVGVLGFGYLISDITPALKRLKPSSPSFRCFCLWGPLLQPPA